MSKHRLLVVDDDPGRLTTLQATLSLAGYEVATADSGRQATELLASGRFDLLLTDLRMPDVSGLELLAEARERVPYMPVIVFSCWGSDAAEWAARYLGAVDFVHLSWNQEDFLPRIAKHLTTSTSSISGHAEGDNLANSIGPATRRWVSIVVAVTHAPSDVPTVNDWADELHKSVSTLKRWCARCGVHAAESLDFGRALRAVSVKSARRVDWYDRLAIVDAKTMTAFLNRAGFSANRSVPELGPFLAGQRFITNGTLLNAIETAMIQ